MKYIFDSWKKSVVGSAPRITAHDEEWIYPVSAVSELPTDLWTKIATYTLEDVILLKDSLVFVENGIVLAAVLLGESEESLLVLDLYVGDRNKADLCVKLLRFSLEELDRLFPGSYQYISYVGDKQKEVLFENLMQGASLAGR